LLQFTFFTAWGKNCVWKWIIIRKLWISIGIMKNTARIKIVKSKPNCKYTQGTARIKKSNLNFDEKNNRIDWLTRKNNRLLYRKILVLSSFFQELSERACCIFNRFFFSLFPRFSFGWHLPQRIDFRKRKEKMEDQQQSLSQN
jgi:hypothetical protein